ncbi:tetratricopeptide repeat protein [Oecophyllibacter saccharovorans]|uniref:tetratricopeptide repeat protein n=1 Tax=Oecophyllibacter saccharovorans TaxID=2558360 RepID=UPI0011448A72|nr:tetratricopeptide repeat protein [Oecophyllibacter saccharovorans]QDH14546.1 tetratricopeptide repeat protein [Oecophyllibacter saccharovorans]
MSAPKDSFTPFVSGTDALENHVLACLQARQSDEALLLAEHLSSPIARNFLEGWALFQLGNLPEAARCFLRLPDFSGSPHPLALIQNTLCEEVEERGFLTLLTHMESFSSPSPALYGLRAMARLILGEAVLGETELRQALKVFPGHPALHNALATLLADRGEFAEAATLLTGLTQKLPDHWTTHGNLGTLLTQIGQAEKALEPFRRAIALAPHEARLRLNHSLALLKAERFAQGWLEHEWRLKLPGHTTLPSETLLPTLDSTSPAEMQQRLHGRTVLITQEEGLGDMLMYLRYLVPLAATGARLHVWCSAELASLVSNLECVDTVQVGGETPEHDYHCPFISLPRVFSALPTPEQRCPPSPYLSVSPLRRQRMLERLAPYLQSDTLRVGLVWAGGHHRHDRTARVLDRHRSMSLHQFAPLTALGKQIQLFSLQKGPAAAQLEDFPGPIINLMEACEDLEDTAALIEQLDLVVSVDTSVLHLAGALGRKAILLDRYTNCWRWGQGTTESPWYPSLKILRQPRHGAWAPVIAQLGEILAAKATRRSD